MEITRVRHAPAAAGAVLGLAAIAETLARHTPPPVAGDGWAGRYLLVLCLLGVAGTVPAVLRSPVTAAMTVTGFGVLTVAALDTWSVGGVTAQLVVAYRLGRGGPPYGAGLLGLPYLVVALAGDPRLHAVALLVAALTPVAATVGIARRVRREDAERTAVHDAFADTLMEHTAHRERARIARELHDVVAHHISLIAVQAETARLTTPGMPPAGAQRLTAIGDTARSALTEMRRLLGVLRADAQPAPDHRPEPADRRPQPGLRQLNELLDEAREATGAGTRLILRGSPVDLDPGVELAAYRIVQEALTNARRHAPGAAVDVELHYTAGALRLAIRDNGPGPATMEQPAGSRRPSGLGLAGMRERAGAVGGELRTGAGRAGGFLVQATLPTDAEDTR